MKNSRSSPTPLVPALIELVFGTVRALVRPHTGQFISCGFTMAAACYVISDSRRGRRDNTSEGKAEFTGLKAEISGFGAEIKSEISGIKADLAVIRDKVEYCQSMVVEGGHHIMKALDGNKQPIRQWLQELEDRKEGSKMDCNPTRRA